MFSRVYIGVFTTLLMVVILVTGSLMLVERITYQKQQSPLIKTLLLVAANHIRSSEDVQTVADQLGVEIGIVPFSRSHFSSITFARLKAGQLVTRSLENGQLEAMTILEQETNQGQRALVVLFDKLQSTYISGMYNLLDEQLARLDNSGESAITRYLSQYPIDVTYHTNLPHELTDLAASSYLAPQYFAQYDLDRGLIHYYAQLPRTGGIIEVGPVKLREDVSILAVLVVLAMAMLLLGLSVYWLVHGFELRLQRLQRASSRIASGRLNSRVKVETEDAVGALGLAFNRMAEQIQRLVGVQREMIRAVSHELRTPVARMRFGVQMLEDTVNDDYVQKQLSAMDGDIQELDELIDEILTYARLEEGGPILEFKPANILDLINQVVEETRRRTDKVTIEAQSNTTEESQIFTEIEFRYMHRAIQNLVGNACRYASENVQVRYGFKDGICRIDVSDDGPGIPEKEWERVFSPFMRLDDSRTRASGGYGLGLSIVQRIIFWHSGKAIVGRSDWGGAQMSLIWPQYHHNS